MVLRDSFMDAQSIVVAFHLFTTARKYRERTGDFDITKEFNRLN